MLTCSERRFGCRGLVRHHVIAAKRDHGEGLGIRVAKRDRSVAQEGGQDVARRG